MDTLVWWDGSDGGAGLTGLGNPMGIAYPLVAHGAVLGRGLGLAVVGLGWGPGLVSVATGWSLLGRARLGAGVGAGAGLRRILGCPGWGAGWLSLWRTRGWGSML